MLKTSLLFRAALLVSLSLASACSNEVPPDSGPVVAPAGGLAQAPPAAPVALPDKIEIADPDNPVTLMDQVEDDSEEVANRFVDFSFELKRRDFGKAAEWLAEDFAGQALFGDIPHEVAAKPLDSELVTYDHTAAPIVDKAGWAAALQTGLGPWERVDGVVVKVKGAEFNQGRPRWGKIRFRFEFFGLAAGGGKRAVTAWTWGRVEKRRGKWMLTALELTSLKTERRDAALFTEVSTTTGLAKSGIRFGKPGNTRFAWQGVAGGDVNGDGLWDLYMPSETENFLYIAQPDGTFVDRAEAWGVKTPAGGTASIFLDFDNDGDQDLFCADEGWEGPGGDREGNPLRLFVNDGKKFEEKGSELGFTGIVPAYTLTALDYDLDGFVDVFVCNYGVQSKEPNNDWLSATNGGTNMLFKNLGGKGFRDVAKEAGVNDGRWTYASAAADFDGDGDIDLNVANDYGTNTCLENQGDGTFVNRSEEWGIGDRGNGMGTMWGDFNSDGRLDLYVANMSSTAGNRILKRMNKKDDAKVKGLLKMAAGNSIFIQQEDGSFVRQEKAMGGVGASWAWCPLTFDMNLDGHLDVYNCSGYVTGDSAADT